ncbi:MAG: hypothetical protein JST69_11570 [Bacteroidetes bacterium]|nr:hypothetical protein [Bacteroidota bacterium]
MKIFEILGKAITSMSAIIFVLAMVVASGTFFSHTLFYEVFPSGMTEWEKSIATWTLACAWELTVLLTTVNTNYIGKKIPIAMAVCSGLIILLFLHGFDGGLSLLDYFKRFFIGILVAYINIVFSSLFLSAWQESRREKTAEEKLKELELLHEEQTRELVKTKSELDQSKKDFDQLFLLTEELEKFKKMELEKLICPHCNQPQKSVFHLSSHKALCNAKQQRNEN